MIKDFKKIILDNGVKLYLYSDKNLKRVYVSYSVNFGSNGKYNTFYYKGERKTIPFGTAHFIEHLLIEKSKFGNMLHNFAELGYETNGTTYDELTNYYFIGIDNINSSIKSLIEMVDNPVFTEEDVKDVIPAVVEELNSRLDDKFSFVNSNNFYNMFKSFKLSDKTNVLGTAQRTSKFTYEEIKLAYDAYYYDENKYLIIAGNIDEKKIIKLVNDIYKKMPRHQNNYKEFNYQNLDAIRNKMSFVLWNKKIPYLVINSFKIKDEFGLDRVKFCTYMMIYFYLKFGRTTHLVQDLVNKNYLIDHIDPMFEYVEVSDEKYLFLRFVYDCNDYDKVFKTIKDNLNSKDLLEEEFDLIKKDLLVSNIKLRDYIYELFKVFPYRVNFSEKLDETEIVKSLSYKELIELINKINFDTCITSILEYKG